MIISYEQSTLRLLEVRSVIVGRNKVYRCEVGAIIIIYAISSTEVHNRSTL